MIIFPRHLSRHRRICRTWVVLIIMAVSFIFPEVGASASHEIPMLPPANDNFADATAVTALTFTHFVYAQNGTVEEGEPGVQDYDVADLLIGESSVWYRFTPEISGSYRFSSEVSRNNLEDPLNFFCSSCHDQTTKIYTGTTLSSLDLQTSYLYRFYYRPYYIIWEATAGITYHIRVAERSWRRQVGSLNTYSLVDVVVDLVYGYETRITIEKV